MGLFLENEKVGASEEFATPQRKMDVINVNAMWRMLALLWLELAWRTW
jgi:hypothetical protein